MKKILIIGATSAIAEATARIWAKRGDILYLVARNGERLEMIAADLKIRGAGSVFIRQLDVNDFEQHESVVRGAVDALGSLDIALIAHGTLGDQELCERDFSATLHELNSNAISVISLLTHLANYCELHKCGTLAVISSVAGDRGRQSNYIYGTAKGAVTTFLQGLRQRLFKSGVHVLTIKPGFVDTPMTSNFKKGALWSGADTIARVISVAIDRRKDIAYAPWFWRVIMLIILLIPERIFKRMVL